MRIVVAALALALSCTILAGADEPSTVVTLSPEGDALHAAYVLAEPTGRFVFEGYNTPQRRDGWTPDEGWTFDGEALARADGAAFDAFTLRLPPDARFHDRRYVAVDRVGADGWVVLLLSLRAAEGETEVRFAGFGAEAALWIGGEAQADPLAPIAAGEDAELVYVGPPDNVIEGPMTVIAGAEVPPWLRERFVEDLGRVVLRLTERFGAAPQTTPALVVTYQQEWRGRGYKGGVLGGATVAFRLRGVILDESDDELAVIMTNSAAHEAVHLWNGRIWRQSDNEQQPWLSEGGAEYLASRLWQDAESLRAETEERLNGCAMRDNRDPLDGAMGPVHGAAPYDCGFILQLAAEAASVAAGNGDTLDLWRASFDGSVDGEYSTESFLDEAAARGGDAFTTLAEVMLADFATLDAQALASALGALGIEVATRPADGREGRIVRDWTLRPILAGWCQGSWSFNAFDDRIRLNADPRCGEIFAGDPEVVSLNGVDLIGSPVEAHATARAACAAGGEVIFGLVDGGALPPTPCVAAVPDLPPVFTVSALPALPDL